uniref:Uncharacterized protein n=1 Tax=Anguilla anguilla TaxID=7936 RepID=A0A0E9VTW6_ANGAN
MQPKYTNPTWLSLQ